MIIYSTTFGRLILKQLNNKNKDPFIYSIKTEDKIVEIGFSLVNNSIIWTAEQKDKFTLNLVNMSINYDKNGNVVEPEPLIISKGNDKFLFAFDWIHNLIYRSFTNNIVVSNIKELDEKVSIYKTDSKISSLTLFPENSYIFWSECQQNLSEICSIYRANQDGSQRKLLISQISTAFIGLTIDFKNDILFFYDSLSIYSIEFNGNDLIKIYDFGIIQLQEHIGIFDVINDTIYFSHLNKTN